MDLSEFKIGENFYRSGRAFRCTDIGSRVVIGVPLQATRGRASITDGVMGAPVIEPLSEEETLRGGWLNGPPYALAEMVFDEDDLEDCTVEPEIDEAA
jgi:hypothetical protein